MRLDFIFLSATGIIHCHLEANPEYTFITWTKDKRIFDPFDLEGIQSLKNGSLFITKVSFMFKSLPKKKYFMTHIDLIQSKPIEKVSHF